MKKNLIKLSILFFIIFLYLNASSQVTKDNYKTYGWKIDINTKGLITDVKFVCGPGTPPEGQGSLEFSIEKTTDRVRFRNTNYHETHLKDITDLRYFTSVTPNNYNNAPILTLQIDEDGIDTDGKDGYENDFNINFVPKFQTQGVSSASSWQEWNALTGEWSFFDPKTNHFVDPISGNQITDFSTLGNHTISFAQYLTIKNKKYENAMITNTTDPGTAVVAGGIRFTAGSGGLLTGPSDEWNDFKGSIDKFIIKIGEQNTDYDFEYKLKITNTNQGLCFGYPNVIGSKNAVPGTSYSWTSTGGDLPVPENSPYLIIIPTATATPPAPVIYTLTETTTGGCIYTTNVEVEVYKGICPDRIENWWIRFLKNYGIVIIAAIVVIWGCFRVFRNMRNQRTENIKH